MQLILSQTTSCASCALPPAAWAPFCTPFRSMLLPLTPTYPIGTCSPPPSCTCMPAHMGWVQRRRAACDPPTPPQVCLCAPQGWEQRGRERFLGHQAIICPGKHRAHHRQNLTDCFYYISCHKTHFLGGYTPASPPLSFCSPLPEEGHLRSSHKYYCPGLPPAGPGPLRLSRGNRNPERSKP